MELQIWDGDWGLPSVDHNCLTILAYCKFLNITVEVNKCGNPWKSPSGTFPVLSHANGIETEVKNILNFLQNENISAALTLSSKESADNVAYASLMEEKLYPALLYLWWVDNMTYVELTRPWYSKKLMLPLCWYLPMKKRNEAIARMETMRGKDTYLEFEHEAQLTKDAKECLNLLSAKLGDKQYFLGDKPSSVDALAFGYLAPLLNAPLSNLALQNHLKACRNLVQFCQRILDTYFPLSPEEQETNRKLAEEARHRLSEETEFPNRRRNMVIAAAVVLGSMVGYALLNGLIQLEFVDVDQKLQNRSPDHVARMLEEKDENGSAE